MNTCFCWEISFVWLGLPECLKGQHSGQNISIQRAFLQAKDRTRDMTNYYFFYALCKSLKWVICWMYRSVNWKLKVNRWTHTQLDTVTEKVFMLKWGVPQCKIVFKYSEWARRSLMTPPVPFWTNSSTHSGFIVVCQPTAICATLNQLACH